MATSPVNRGFSLPELLCALAITAVLLGLILPAHQAHRHRVERVQAARALEGAAACQAAGDAVDRPIPREGCLPAATKAYVYELVESLEGPAGGHEWRARPRSGQLGDACGALILDHRGRRTVGGSRPAGDCWRGR